MREYAESRWVNLLNQFLSDHLQPLESVFLFDGFLGLNHHVSSGGPRPKLASVDVVLDLAVQPSVAQMYCFQALCVV